MNVGGNKGMVKNECRILSVSVDVCMKFSN